MQENQTQPPVQDESKKPKKAIKVVVAAFVAVLFLGMGYVIYSMHQLQIDRYRASIDMQRKEIAELQQSKLSQGQTTEFEVKELNFSFTPDDRLNGLTYSYHDDGENARVEFSTSDIITALENVPNYEGQPWMIGNLVTIKLFSKSRVDGDSSLKQRIIAEFENEYLVELVPQNGPHGGPGFEEYASIYKEQQSMLRESLKSAKKTVNVTSDIYTINDLRLKIVLDDKTSDLIAEVEDGRAWFTLDDFLKEANEAGYSHINDQGVNSCGRLVAMTVFENAKEVRSYPTEVTGQLIDENDKPVKNRILQMDDGRYVLLSGAQAPCNIDTTFDGSIIQKKNIAAKDAIIKAITEGIRSY